jgi:RNA polymerase sigma-70 factor (ECF subfamily)
MTPDDHVPRRAVLAADARNSGPEMALMKRVAAGVPEAQEELAERLVMRVRRGAHALMRGSSDADDSAQLALIEILRSAHNYSGRASVERWADRIVGRSVIRFSRAVRRRAGAFATNAGDEDSTLELSDRPPRNLDECLGRLPVTAREALLLRHAFGQSVDEIAELTQVSPDTVRDRLLLARKEFRRLALSRPRESMAAAARAHRGAS